MCLQGEWGAGVGVVERVHIFLGQDLKGNLPVIHKQRYKHRVKIYISVSRGMGIGGGGGGESSLARISSTISQ